MSPSSWSHDFERTSGQLIRFLLFVASIAGAYYIAKGDYSLPSVMRLALAWYAYVGIIVALAAVVSAVNRLFGPGVGHTWEIGWW